MEDLQKFLKEGNTEERTSSTSAMGTSHDSTLLIAAEDADDAVFGAMPVKGVVIMHNIGRSSFIYTFDDYK